MLEDLGSQGTAQQQAYRYIRQQIMSGTYAGGAKLNPSEIAEILGLSRMPVHEAILQLDAEGLVNMRPNRGAIVTSLSPDDVQELFEMRAVLEGLAVRMAMPHLVGETMEDLLVLKQRMDRARGDGKLWTARHDDFHDFLCRQSRRPRLTADISRIRAAVQPYLLMYINVYDSIEMEGYEHETIIDAIRSGNSSLVEMAVRNHVLSAGNGVIEFLRKKGPKAPQSGRQRRSRVERVAS